MNIVVDANVIKGLWQEIYLGVDTELSGQSATLFARIDNGTDIAYLDDGGHIKHEWGNVVDSEWFDPWYSRNLQSGKFQLIPVNNFPEINKKLRQLGWPPQKNRDIWYVRTAKQITESIDEAQPAYLVAEDLHFFDPRELRGSGRARRIKRMSDGRGPVFQYLRNKHNIHTMCVFIFNKII